MQSILFPGRDRKKSVSLRNLQLSVEPVDSKRHHQQGADPQLSPVIGNPDYEFSPLIGLAFKLCRASLTEYRHFKSILAHRLTHPISSPHTPVRKCNYTSSLIRHDEDEPCPPRLTGRRIPPWRPGPSATAPSQLLPYLQPQPQIQLLYYAPSPPGGETMVDTLGKAAL